MVFLYIVLGIIVIIIVKLLIYFFNTTNFYNSVINEYIKYRKSGNSRYESNKKVISRNITGSNSFSISPQASDIISRFDALDSVQFLIWFNNSLSSKLDTIPKMSASDLRNNSRQKLINTAFKKDQWEYINSIPDLRNNTIDLYDEFKELGSLLIKDFDLFYRIQK